MHVEGSSSIGGTLVFGAGCLWVRVPPPLPMKHITKVYHSRWDFLYCFPSGMPRWLINKVGSETLNDQRATGIEWIANQIRIATVSLFDHEEH